MYMCMYRAYALFAARLSSETGASITSLKPRTGHTRTNHDERGPHIRFTVYGIERVHADPTREKANTLERHNTSEKPPLLLLFRFRDFFATSRHYTSLLRVRFGCAHRAAETQSTQRDTPSAPISRRYRVDTCRPGADAGARRIVSRISDHTPGIYEAAYAGDRARACPRRRHARGAPPRAAVVCCVARQLALWQLAHVGAGGGADADGARAAWHVARDTSYLLYLFASRRSTQGLSA